MLADRADDVIEGIARLTSPGFDLHQSFVTYRQKADEQGVDVKELWRIARYFEESSGSACSGV
jgi:hypothetical protein